MADTTHLSDDEKRLAELGYKQELNRNWSGFSNFAISFSIISILAGCFTTFGQAWNNGGPIAISLGWPLISAFILIIGFCMSELVSAFPTSGGIYWWASKLGGARAGFYTGWLNLVGLIAILASVAYGCATFLNISLAGYLWKGWGDAFGGDVLRQQFALFVIILVAVTVLNIFSSHLMAIMNNISVWWHVFGAAAVVLILVVVPDDHQGLSFVFSERFNNSGFGGGSHGNATFWLYVLPLGFLLTQYTITGYDACAHLSEETEQAASSAAKGIWRSIFYSAIGGWILLLAFLFAANDPKAVDEQAGFVGAIFQSAMSSRWAGTIFIISTVGQFFCTVSCMTSCSRMIFAFSRDGAIPGSGVWRRISATRVPTNAVLLGGIVSLLITLPALYKSPSGAPTAFYAVVSIGVIGLYVAFAIPIWLRLQAGDEFRTGPWTLGSKYRWMCWVSVVEITIISVYFILPTVPQGWPGNKNFTWTAVNYAPIITGGVLIAITIWWQVSARHWFTGPKHTIDPAVVEAFDD
jgi:amino acid transporter